MEPDLEEYEEYLIEIQSYRKSTIDRISDKYTNNGTQDFLIDMKTLKVIYKGVKPRLPSYGSLTKYYFCESARKLHNKVSSCHKKNKDTSQKDLLECGNDSGIGIDTSGTSESSQEYFTSRHEEFEMSSRRHDSKVSEDLDSSPKIPICEFAFRKNEGIGFEKDLDSSLEKSTRDFSLRKNKGKGFEKDLDNSLKKSKRDFSFRKNKGKGFEKDLDSSLKKSKRDFSLRKNGGIGFENSKFGNSKPNIIAVHKKPSYLRNIPLDILSISSNSINCSLK